MLIEIYLVIICKENICYFYLISVLFLLTTLLVFFGQQKEKNAAVNIFFLFYNLTFNFSSCS